MLYRKELKVALGVVKKASRLCYKVQKSLVDIKPNELPRSRAARYQKEFLLIPMQSIDEFF